MDFPEDFAGIVSDPARMIAEGDQQHARALELLSTYGRDKGFVLFCMTEDDNIATCALIHEAGKVSKLMKWAVTINQYAEILSERAQTLVAARFLRLLFSDAEESEDDDDN